MSTMNISLPDELKDFVDHRIQAEGYGSSSEYMRELIRRDRDRVQFRQYLLDGIDAKPVGRMDATYFAGLRRRLKIRPKKAGLKKTK
jgi:antitoxin ParD1/3/4